MPENHVASLVPFFSFLPKSAAAEMRTLTVQNHHLLPDDEYALLEFYCIDPTCDCRRVTLTVLARNALELDTLAAISLAFDRDGEMVSPFLDPVIVQSPYAEALLEIVAPILESDTVFVAELESRYRQATRTIPSTRSYRDIWRKAKRD